MRPNFITPEQIARWDENIKNDEALAEVVSEHFSQDETLKELLYASLWLHEEMIALGFDSLIVAASQNTLGVESFGKDPWEVAQLMYDSFCQIKPEKLSN